MCLEAIHYLLTKIGETDKIKIVKLMYFADKMHLMLFGRTITDDKFIAMQYGPVGSCTLDAFKKNDSFFVSKGDHKFEATNINSEYDYLSESDKLVIDKIAKKFKNGDFKDIVETSHKCPEWKVFKPLLDSDTKKTAKIKLRDMFSTFPGDPLSLPEELIKETKNAYIGA